MKYTLIAIIALVALCYFRINDNTEINQYISQFQTWKLNFNKIYQNEAEEIYRLTLFMNNVKQINRHNSNIQKTYEMGINQFTDLTQQEFAQRYLTLTPQNQNLRIQSSVSLKEDDRQINWVEKGYVSSVKNEGQCGACWAFAAIGPIEAQLKMKGQPLLSLSAQQLMDCSGNYGNYGCSGGYMTNAYKYIRDAGITTQDLYPYVGAFQKCLTYGGQYKIKGFTQLQDCKNLADALMNLPIAVGVDASKFYNYKSGVFTCADKPTLNHAFALVGMTKDYWLGKEQWGVNWGENGYIKISKSGSACGICTMASYPN